MKKKTSKSLAVLLSLAVALNIAGGRTTAILAAETTAPANSLQDNFKAVLKEGPAAAEKLTSDERKALAALLRSNLQKIRTGEAKKQIAALLLAQSQAAAARGAASKENADQILQTSLKNLDEALANAAAAFEKALALLHEPIPAELPARENKNSLPVFQEKIQEVEAQLNKAPSRQDEAAAAAFWDGALAAKALEDAPAADASSPAARPPQFSRRQIFYTDNSRTRTVPPLAENQDKKHGFNLKDWLSNLYNRVYHPADGENTKWLYAPIKLVSFPAVKIMYDLPTLATSTVTESVTRSPWHNLRATLDTAYGMVRSAIGGVWKMVKGILNPTKATIVDGALQLVDTCFSALKTAAGAVKSAASVVGYPAYRLLGGGKSVRAPLPGKGKRAAIVLIDSALPFGFGNLIDAFGDQIVRYHFARTADYYCAASLSNGSSGSVADCIEKMPKDIKNVDFIALTHSGGMNRINSLAQDAAREGKRPGIVVSIGCNDPASTMTEPENTIGQQGTSWAVHFYLGGMLEKRLRGIPIQQAAMQAYREGMLVNAFNPISVAAILTIGAMETPYNGLTSLPAIVLNGYSGSKPRLADREAASH